LPGGRQPSRSNSRVMACGVEVSAFISERPAQAITRLLERDGCLPPGNPFGGGLATAN